MRWLISGVVLVAACSGSDGGALLTIHAPDGPVRARLEIVLADPAAIEDIDRQRVAPGQLGSEPVRYFKQRTIAGSVDAEPLDGFALRIEPDPEVVAGSDLVPFLIAYDGDAIVGIGAVLDDRGGPRPITIVGDQLVGYTVELAKLSATDGGRGVGPGEVTTVRCEDRFDSGFAWNPGGTQLRLLLPDPDGNDATDATARSLDLDCDGAVADATASDCDDLHPRFHAGATETCDGLDLDCDGRMRELVTCTDVSTAACPNSSGVGLCLDDTTPGNGTNAVVGCQPDASCLCQSNQCESCVLPFTGTPDTTDHPLCEPYLAEDVDVPGCEGACDVEVLDVPNDPWRVKISTNGGPFGPKLTGVGGKIDIEVDLPGGDSISSQPGSVVGSFVLAVQSAGDPSPHLVVRALRLDVQPSGCQAGEPTPMICN